MASLATLWALARSMVCSFARCAGWCVKEMPCCSRTARSSYCFTARRLRMFSRPLLHPHAATIPKEHILVGGGPSGLAADLTLSREPHSCNVTVTGEIQMRVCGENKQQSQPPFIALAARQTLETVPRRFRRTPTRAPLVSRYRTYCTVSLKCHRSSSGAVILSRR